MSPSRAAHAAAEDKAAASTPRILLLLRHAKAEQGHGKLDHQRELAARGRRDARAAGQWLSNASDAGVLPPGALDLVLCSTSERTRQTLEAVCAGGVSVTDAGFDERIYDAGAAGLLDVLREVPDSVRTVLMIGHAPGIPVLASALTRDLAGSAAAEGSAADGSDVADALVGDRLAQGFPTCGLAVLAFQGSWAALAPATAYLREFVVPRR